MYDLHGQIVKKFRLFEGVRSRDEDEKIYDKVSGLLALELGKFVEENLDEKGKVELEKKLTQANLADNAWSALLSSMSNVPDLQSKLQKRIENYLKNLVYDSLYG